MRRPFDAYGTPLYTQSRLDGNVQSEEWRATDSLGRLAVVDTSIDGAMLGTVSYDYEANGAIAGVSTSWAGGYSFLRNGSGQITDIRDSTTTAVLAQIDNRDALGRPTHAWMAGSGDISRSYDQNGRIATWRVHDGANDDQRAFYYDELGRSQQVDHVDASGAWAQAFTYDTPGWLVEDQRIDDTGVESTVYAYDAAGNRTSVTRDGVVTGYTYDVADKLLTVGPRSLTYDAFGGIIDDGNGFGIPRSADGSEIGLDAISGSSVTPLYTFWRNAAGQPLATDDGGARRRQVWGNPGADLPLAGDGPDGAWMWIDADGLVLGQLRGGVAVAAASDPLGSIAYLDGTLAGVAGAFGEGSGLADERYAWAGLQSLPGTPYQLAQHRLYDTDSGRFTVNDPIGLAGGDHRFAYAGNDPVGFVDPSGLSRAAGGGSGFSASYVTHDIPTALAAGPGGMLTGFLSEPSRLGTVNWATVRNMQGQPPISPDECGFGGCPSPTGEPGDEQDGTGRFGPHVPVLSAGPEEVGGPDRANDALDESLSSYETEDGTWGADVEINGNVDADGGDYWSGARQDPLDPRNQGAVPGGGSGLGGEGVDPSAPTTPRTGLSRLAGPGLAFVLSPVGRRVVPIVAAPVVSTATRFIPKNPYVLAAALTLTAAAVVGVVYMSDEPAVAPTQEDADGNVWTRQEDGRWRVTFKPGSAGAGLGQTANAPPALGSTSGASDPKWSPGKQLWSKGKLGEHFEKQGEEVGAGSRSAYSEAAAAFGQAENTGQFVDMTVGAFFYRFEESTSRVFVGTLAGQQIKTFYKWDGREDDVVILALKEAGKL